MFKHGTTQASPTHDTTCANAAGTTVHYSLPHIHTSTSTSPPPHTFPAPRRPLLGEVSTAPGAGHQGAKVCLRGEGGAAKCEQRYKRYIVPCLTLLALAPEGNGPGLVWGGTGVQCSASMAECTTTNY